MVTLGGSTTIKDFFLKSRKSLSELILETSTELGKCYSTLEFSTAKLSKRVEDLLDECIFYLGKGSKARASVYANEIAEIRRALSILQHTQLCVEKTILRLDTIKVVTPTIESLEGVFGDVRNAIGLIANVMPSINPEINRLNSVINEVFEGTQFNPTIIEQTPVTDPTAEAILKEAESLVKKEAQMKIPEPPAEIPKPQRVLSKPPLIAVTTNGSELPVNREDNKIESSSSSVNSDVSDFLLKELVMDYIERNDGDINIDRCSVELNLPFTKIYEALDMLSKEGKIVFQ